MSDVGVTHGGPASPGLQAPTSCGFRAWSAGLPDAEQETRSRRGVPLHPRFCRSKMVLCVVNLGLVRPDSTSRGVVPVLNLSGPLPRSGSPSGSPACPALGRNPRRGLVSPAHPREVPSLVFFSRGLFVSELFCFSGNFKHRGSCRGLGPVLSRLTSRHAHELRL